MASEPSTHLGEAFGYRKSILCLLAWFDVRRLAVALLFVGLFAMAVRTPAADTDTWWHLQSGRVMWETRRPLRIDLFSHTRAGVPWVNHSWLSQVWMFWLFDYFAQSGLALWVASTVVATFALVYLQMEGSPFTRAFIVILAAVTSAVVWIARPQLVSLLFTATVSYVLYLWKWRGVNRIWTLPPLFVLWVNLHAGYVLGFMVLAAFIGGELLNHALNRILGPSLQPVLNWRQLGWLAWVSILSALLLAINPNTTRMWTYYLDTVNISVLQDYIQEWQSPDFHPLHTQPFIWLLLITCAAFGLSGRRVDGTDLVLVGLFAYAALLAARNIGPFALVTAPALSRHVNAFLTSARAGERNRPRYLDIAIEPRARPLFGAVNLWLLILLTALATFKVRMSLNPAADEEAQRRYLPVQAVAWIREHRPPGEIFNPYNWGGYLIWELWPDYRVFVDGRTDLYGDALLAEYLEIQRGEPGWETKLARYNVNLVLTYPDDALSARLECDRGWKLVYRDDMAVIWQRVAHSQ